LFGLPRSPLIVSPRYQADFDMGESSMDHLETLFTEALARCPAERAAYIQKVCGSEPALKRRLEAMIASHEANDGFLEVPADSRRAAIGGSLPADVEGIRIGPYTIHRMIASGGMGVVYEAQQDHPSRLVALKVMHCGMTAASSRQRFQHEVEILGRLQHPNIARVYDAGMYHEAGLPIGAVPYFAMELVEGQPLRDYANAQGLDMRQRLALIAQIGDAVHHAHQKGVIHRDLKPANILVTSAGEPKILDFGVARATASDVQMTTAMTEAGQLIGTILYMSPEQFLGDAQEIDIRSDVYALGVLTYELLAGRLPHALDKLPIAEAARVAQEAESPLLGTIVRSLRGDVETIVAKSMEKSRQRRYQSALEFAADIRRYLSDEPISARPPTALYQLRKFARRNRNLVAGLAIVVVLFMMAVGGTSYGLIEATRERKAAERAAQEAQAISTFLHEMLSSVDPSEAGYQVTVVQVLDQATEDLETQFADQPTVRASLHLTIGDAYMALGRYSDGHKHLRAALDLRLELLGEHHPATLEAMQQVAGSRVDSDEAIELLRWVYGERRRTLGAWDPETLASGTRLFLACLHASRFVEAEALHEDIAPRMREALPAVHPTALRFMYASAVMLRQLGRLAEAEAALRGMLRVCEGLDDKESRHTLAAMERISELLGYFGCLDEAEAMLRYPLDVKRKVLGAGHPAAISSACMITRVLLEQQRFDEADALGEATLALARNAHARGGCAALVDALWSLGRLRRHEGRMDEADALLREAVLLSQEELNPTDALRYSVVIELATLKLDVGDTASAEALLEKTVAAMRRHPPNDRLIDPQLHGVYGRCLAARGRVDEGRNRLTMAHAEFRNLLGPAHEWTRQVEDQIAALEASSSTDAVRLFATPVDAGRDMAGEAIQQPAATMHAHSAD